MLGIAEDGRASGDDDAGGIAGDDGPPCTRKVKAPKVYKTAGVPHVYGISGSSSKDAVRRKARGLDFLGDGEVDFVWARRKYCTIVFSGSAGST